MKKYSILFCLLMQLAFAFAQAPEKMSYQAVVRNNNNVLVNNHAVGMRISILQGSATGTAVYTETQTPTTNANGLIAIEIGTGTVVTGTFSNIDWANGPFFVKTETDPNGGTAYTLTSCNQLLSVPYALHAKTALNGVPSGAQQGQSLTMCDGQLVWATGGLCPAKISGFNCADTVHVGLLVKHIQTLNGVITTISYNGGNGGVFSSQSFTSSGVTGLTASIKPGILNYGTGKLELNIFGTPSSDGIASFMINFGGTSCIVSRKVFASPLFPTNSVFCNSLPTEIIDVVNPTTGKTWMDRNLGATQAATSSTDAAAYGDLYQWGRRADGHQCRNSGTIGTISNLSSTDQPTHSNFIIAPNSPPYDWRTPQNDNLWQGVNGVNNPCPTGYRLPTYTELEAERTSWSQNNNIGAFGSPLKLPMAGYHSSYGGSLGNVGSYGYYWSSTVTSTLAWKLAFYSGTAYMDNDVRADGFSVRCIKD